MTASFHLNVNDSIYLSDIRSGDLSALVRFLDEWDIYRYTSRIPHPYLKPDAKKFLRLARQATRRFGHPIHFAIRNESAQLIGAVGFGKLVSGHSTEIGYWLAKPYWKQGIMTHVVGAACQYAMDEWNLVRIAARVFEGNTASACVLTKNGFQLEGLMRKVEKKDGKFVNLQLFSRVSD